MSGYPNAVRRKDRQQTDLNFLKSLLHSSVSCSIAIQREGYPLNHVAFFVYDEGPNEIIFHFSTYGFAGKEIVDGKKVYAQSTNTASFILPKERWTSDANTRVSSCTAEYKFLHLTKERIAAMQFSLKNFFSGFQEIPRRI